MSRTRSAFSCALSLLLAGSVLAQTIDTSSEEFLSAATVVATFDHFMETCELGTLSGDDVADLETWERDDAAEEIRAFLASADSADVGLVWEIRDELAAEFERYGVTGCLGATALIGVPQADLRAVAPNVIAALTATQTAAPQTGRGTSTATGTQTGSTASSQGEALRLANQIDSFAFDAKYGFGVGGFMTIDVVPVVLFGSGDALLKIEQLSLVDSIEEGRALDAEAWSRWRRQGEDIQVERSGGWENLPFTATYSALPPGFALSGTYHSLSGGGSIAFGGTTSVAAWSEYTFLPGGVVVRGGGAGGSSEFGNTSVVVASLPPDRRGSYQIDGIMLNMRFDDGASYSYALVTDPGDDGSAIWLDGIAYSSR